VSKPIRIAQIGVVQPHANGYRATLGLLPEAELIAAYDFDVPEAKAALATEGIDVPFYTDIDTLLKTEKPDAVIITGKPRDVPAAIVAAANAGAHILAEKPCARTAAEFLPAKEAIERAGVQFCTGYLRRSSPVAKQIESLIADGILGDLMSMEISHVTSNVQRRNPNHWMFDWETTGGGILNWLGVHWLDLTYKLSGQEIATVSAELGTLSGHKIGVEDTAAVTMRLEKGAIATVNCSYSFTSWSDKMWVGIRGTHGAIIWDQDGPEFTVRSEHPSWKSSPNRVFRQEADPKGGYGGQMGIDHLRSFFASFRDGGEPLFVPGDVVRVLNILDAARESSNTGRRIDLTAKG
jgi:predicted dehydrogenase